MEIKEKTQKAVTLQATIKELIDLSNARDELEKELNETIKLLKGLEYEVNDLDENLEKYTITEILTHYDRSLIVLGMCIEDIEDAYKKLNGCLFL